MDISDSKRVLHAILESGDFTRLEEYVEPSSWPRLSEERALLASLFTKAGEHALRNGDDPSVLFHRAVSVSQDAADILFKQGMIFEKHEASLASLERAAEKFQQAADLNPSFFDALIALGRTYAKRGAITGESSYFSLSSDIYLHAEKVASGNIMFEGLLSWQRALLAYWEGSASGEVSDYHRSLQHYKSAKECGCNMPEFWTGYASLLMKMGDVLSRDDLYNEALGCYSTAVTLDETYFGGWLALANALVVLYEKTFDEKMFTAANDSFATAAALKSNNYLLLLNWGRLLTLSGMAHHDSQRIRTGLPKLVAAQRVNSKDPFLYRYWGEALIAQGKILDTLNFFRQAETTIVKGIDLAPEDDMLWYHYGVCYNEYGNYFDDERYHLQAIEKFNAGLVYREHSPLLSYGLALSYAALADMRLDDTLIQKACQCFSTAYHYGERSSDFFGEWGLALMRYSELMHNESAVVDALGKFEEAIQRIPPDVEDSDLYYHYGCCLDLRGDFSGDEEHYERAIDALSHAITIDPGHTDACYNLGVALSHLGTLVDDAEPLQKAVALFENVIDGDNEDDMSWNEWGATLLYLSQMFLDPASSSMTERYIEAAEEKLLRAAALGNIPALYNLASLYSLNNNLDASMHYLRRSYESHTMPPLDDILADDWLHNLRSTESFKSFIDDISP